MIIHIPPAAHKSIFYAGMPLKANNGDVLGTLCVLDVKPNMLKEEQKTALKALAKQVENLFELRRHNLDLEKTTQEFKSEKFPVKEFCGYCFSRYENAARKYDPYYRSYKSKICFLILMTREYITWIISNNPLLN